MFGITDTGRKRESGYIESKAERRETLRDSG